MPRYARYFCFFLLCACGVPFVLQRTVFPFFRFGMFAEPLSSEAQLEVLWVEHEGEVFDASKLGLSTSNWNQLMRNYYYRGEGELLLEQAANGASEKGAWTLLRTVASLDTLSHLSSRDTAVLAQYFEP